MAEGKDLACTCCHSNDKDPETSGDGVNGAEYPGDDDGWDSNVTTQAQVQGRATNDSDCNNLDWRPAALGTSEQAQTQTSKATTSHCPHPHAVQVVFKSLVWSGLLHYF